ncbi:MAG: hypothetical protein ACKOQM_00985 [Novosphingobium sp.]
MKKSDFESALVQVRRLREQLGFADSGAARPENRSPRSRLKAAPPPAVRPHNRGELVAQSQLKDLTVVAKPGFGERPGDGVPGELLDAAIGAYRQNPSHATAARLEMAMNRVGALSSPEDKAVKLMQKAAEALAEPVSGETNDGYQGDNIAVRLYQHSQFAGVSIYGSLSYGGLLTGWINLSQYGFNDRISSLSLTASADEIGGRVVLFQDHHCRGRFARYNVAGGGSNRPGYVGNYINDRTSSVLLYRQFPDERLSNLGSFVTPPAIKAFVDATPGVSSRGDPVLTWDVFPDGSDGHPYEPSKMYVYVRIPVTVEIDNWFDYDAEIRYWIMIYPDSAGNLLAFVEYYGAWVEGGILTDHVLDGLMAPDGIPSTLGRVAGLLSGVTTLANLDGPYSSAFLLPGRFGPTGTTDEDVTVVLVPGTPAPPGPIL